MKKKITSLIILFMMVVSVAWSADTLRLSQLPTTTTLTPATDTLPVVTSVGSSVVVSGGKMQ